METLNGKWALITGSSRGIGQQIALGLAEKGCNLILHGRKETGLAKTQELLIAYPVKVVSVSGDLQSEAGVTSVIEQVRVSGPQVDILYNNAAIMSPWKPLWEITTDDYLETFKVNVFALISLCTAFAPGMVERVYGRIINLTSGIKDIPQLAPYSISKAAVDKYTKDLAAELKGTNVLANVLDPGWLQTDLGGPNADHAVETVLPGALVPALLEDYGASGQFYAAQDYAGQKT